MRSATIRRADEADLFASRPFGARSGDSRIGSIVGAGGKQFSGFVRSFSRGGQPAGEDEEEDEENSLLKKAEDSAAPEAPAQRQRWCPEENANWISKLLYIYVDGLIAKGARKHLEHNDLWDLARSNEAGTVYSRFKTLLNESVDPVKAPQGVIWKALWRAHGRYLVHTGLIKVFHDLVMFLPPFILEQLLHHMAVGGSRVGSFGLAAALFGTALVENVTINIYFHILYVMAMQMKVNMVQMLYDKSIRITGGVKSDMGVGAIVNLQSNDASKIWNLSLYLHIVWNGPFQIFIVMAMLVRLMGWAPAMSGLAVTVVMIPLSTLVGKKLTTIRKEMVKHTDARVKLSSEIITGIKAIKLYAWEEPYVERIEELRAKELAMIRKTQLISSLNSALYMSGPVLVALAAFGVHAAMGYQLTASVAFPALALFNLLRFPIIMFPSQIMSLINAHVGLQRIQKFMEAEEMGSEAGPGGAGSDASSSKGANGFQSNPIGNGYGASANGSAPPAAAIYIRQANFSWESGKDAVIKNIDLTVKRGQLVMVVGQVGCGKSSLLHAILREMHKKSGELVLRGSVAYTAQDPWIQNATLRANVLMGRPYDEGLYTSVLVACALEQDLEMLPAGDMSEIGEKGINLSGGQKHRVALARACYAAADVYLLDDPLSAVDAHVGRHLFDECLCGLLEDRTRVLVTHQLQYLPAADVIVVMSEGVITDLGTYSELINKGVDFNKLITDAQKKAEKEAEVEAEKLAAARASQDKAGKAARASDTGKPAVGDAKAVEKAPLLGGAASSAGAKGEVVPSDAASSVTASSAAATDKAKQEGGEDVDDDVEGGPPVVRVKSEKSFTSAASKARLMKTLSMKESAGKLVKVEERAKGRVHKGVYMAYISSWSSAFYWVPIMVVVMALAERGLQVLQNFVLAAWSNNTAAAQKTGSDTHTKYYMSWYFALGFISIFCQVSRAVLTIAGSITASRVLQRRLLEKVVRLPMSFFDSQPTGRLLNRFTKDTEAIDIQVSGTVSMTMTTAVSAMLSVVVVVIVAPLTIIFLVPLAYVYYKIQGVYIASGRELKRLDSLAFSPIFSHFSESLHGLTTIRAFHAQQQFKDKNRTNLDHSNRAYWPIQVVNRWLSIRLEMMGASVVFAAALFVSVVLPRNAGLAGLAITSALNLTGIMNWAVRQATELEVNMNSVERIIEYDKHEEEAPAVIEGHRPSPNWPSRGQISVQNLCIRYRPELELVLTDLSFETKGCEKVGVCGRTGCGKSTLFLALYRIVEPSSGRILIDGLDVATIGLKDLRSRLSLVPQDPVVFSGTIRSNLDPFQQAPSDAAIWEALTRAGIDTFVRELPLGLDAPIKESGANMSVGQRQLICMARALLRNSKILVLDEATSNVDNATDALIQRTIRTAFRECTVLTIAHRLHTIVDSDRILLLDAGRLKEFDSPRQLLRDPNSSFRKLVDETTSSGGHTADLVAQALAQALTDAPAGAEVTSSA